MHRALLVILLAGAAAMPARAQLRLADESDRSAFRSWFVLLVDAQFYRTTADVTDCAALVRHAYREALRPHTPEWIRLSGLARAPVYGDVRHPPTPTPSGWPLFRVSQDPRQPFAEFADARTLVRYSARTRGRDIGAAQPGDLLYFHNPRRRMPDHLMVFVGRSVFETQGNDWVVYHTGPDPGTQGSTRAGEVRKVRLSDLLQHPSPEWRPLAANRAFVGVFRLAIL